MTSGVRTIPPPHQHCSQGIRTGRHRIARGFSLTASLSEPGAQGRMRFSKSAQATRQPLRAFVDRFSTCPPVCSDVKHSTRPAISLCRMNDFTVASRRGVAAMVRVEVSCQPGKCLGRSGLNQVQQRPRQTETVVVPEHFTNSRASSSPRGESIPRSRSSLF